MRPAANLAGFVDAQRALRTRLGQDVTFVVPGVLVYPAGTPLDPETGNPVDPYVTPISGGSTEVVVRASVVTRPLIGDPNDQSRSSPIGMIASDQLALLVDNADFEPIRNATEARLLSVVYRLTDKRPDGIGYLQRWIIFGEQV